MVNDLCGIRKDARAGKRQKAVQRSVGSEEGWKRGEEIGVGESTSLKNFACLKEQNMLQ